MRRIHLILAPIIWIVGVIWGLYVIDVIGILLFSLLMTVIVAAEIKSMKSR